jgi:UDP-galactopyranose mutase
MSVPAPGKYDYLIVGAGFAGAVIAEQLSARKKKVLVVDRRDHVAGNAYDSYDETGVLVHRYGPHFFHTNAPHVVEYLSRFTDWHPYEHRVLASVEGNLLPVPINRTSLERFYGIELVDDAAACNLLAHLQKPIASPRNSEDVCLARVGHDLYEAVFRPYTVKQWGREPRDLDSTVCGRIPVRTDRDDRYFTDDFQALPAEGYTAMFARMLRGVEVRTGVEGQSLISSAERVVWTGPVDEAFDWCHGELPWRSLEFELRHMQAHDPVQPATVVNWPSLEVPYTRITEYRQATGQAGEWTSLHVETPSSTGDPYYPVPSPTARQLYARYALLSRRRADWTFVGRLARYQYLEMGQVVAQALKIARGLP